MILPNNCLCYRLSGESPFQGATDNETFSLVTAARFTFDEESFEDISDQAKDFISSLLKKDRRFDRSLTLVGTFELYRD